MFPFLPLGTSSRAPNLVSRATSLVWDSSCGNHIANIAPSRFGPVLSAPQPTTDDPSPPSQALQTLRSELLEIFQSQFRTAVTARDEVAVSRFFRLWPEIGAEVSLPSICGLGRSVSSSSKLIFPFFPSRAALLQTEGLQAYGDFVVGLVRGRNMAVGKSESSFDLKLGLLLR